MEEKLVVFSEPNKRQLLSSASSEILNEKAVNAAAAIRERLSQLRPSMETQFFLKQDAVSDLVLRMICSPPPPPRTDILSFIAVSCCWHSQEWSVSYVAGPMSPSWRISQSMVESVMAHRQSPEAGVWLDQLCITQTDENEKKIAVGAMDIIYRSARRLIILIEDVTLTEEEEESALTYDRLYKDIRCEVVDRDLQAAGLISEDFFASLFRFPGEPACRGGAVLPCRHLFLCLEDAWGTVVLEGVVFS
jgi:hypothetical protein